MGRNYQRIKRGMVFWFNINDRVDKSKDPKVEVNGKLCKDFIQYGNRNWLVISNDKNNNESQICNIVPITSSEEKNRIPTHVVFNCRGKMLTILCEQVMTVNQCQLVDYDYTVSDDIMKAVEDALRIHYDIREKKSEYLDGIEASISHVEKIVEKIIEQKIEEVKRRENSINIEDAVLRLGEGLENLFNKSMNLTEKGEKDKVEEDNIISSCDGKEEIGEVEKKEPVVERKTQIDKFYEKYPKEKIKKEKNEVKEKPKNNDKKKTRVWTLEAMREFMNDIETMSPEDIAAKWEYSTINDVYKAKYYVRNKLEHLR